ncbi:MAG: hypothetical protein EOO65_01520 [Methanosarcinales archaeon]|nr:MAG: hypothetical protein EOO65_01520 [Methanosarcinales archaeon]
MNIRKRNLPVFPLGSTDFGVDGVTPRPAPAAHPRAATTTALLLLVAAMGGRRSGGASEMCLSLKWQLG